MIYGIGSFINQVFKNDLIVKIGKISEKILEFITEIRNGFSFFL